MATLKGPARARQWPSPRAGAMWTAGALGWLLCTAGVSYASARELGFLIQFELPTPPEVTRDVVVTDAADAIGRRASFRILLFTDEFRWRLNSYDALDASPERPAFTPEMKAVLNSAEEIIAIGASSEELPSGVAASAGRSMEERRAGRRAEQIAVWIREAVSEPIPVRKLNVGHHAPTKGARTPGKDDTSDQRRVVIVLVLDRDEGVNMDQALRAAMARESLRAPIFETLLTQYSLSAGRAFTWVP